MSSNNILNHTWYAYGQELSLLILESMKMLSGIKQYLQNFATLRPKIVG